MPECPDGHRSDADDYCSVCGLAIAGSVSAPRSGAAATETAPADHRCSNCGEPHGVDDVFCENCGFDFITGSLPQPHPPVTSLGGPAASGQPAAARLRITVDRSFHQRMDAEGVLELPDPLPAPRTVPIVGERVLIGRERPSRGIFPDIDLTSDPAASSRHALLERRADGHWAVTDLTSTNGTYVGDSTVAIPPDTPVPVSAGTPIFVGAWTRLDIVE